jgi:hypothetical protein
VAKGKIKVKIDERAVERAARDIAGRRRAELQRALDRVHGAVAGASVEEVKTKLARELKAVTGERPDAKMVDSWARVIAAGTRIRLELGR